MRWCVVLLFACGPKNPLTNSLLGPAAGNPAQPCAVPIAGAQEDIRTPTTVVGTGTPQSCTSSAFVSAVAKGGVITFSCGDAPMTLMLSVTAKIFNDASEQVVIDGGGKITLSGAGAVRILYQDTCDPAQHWTTSHCDNQPSPALTVQNITFVDGNSTGQTYDGGGGGAIFARGGSLKIVNARFFNNMCDADGPDIGGGAVRALSQTQPVYVVNSTFGGKSGFGNAGSNGGALSSIGVSYTVVNSVFGFNSAIGYGANPAQNGTPGGGSGGAIYNDGDTYTLDVCGSIFQNNVANEGGGAIFFVSDDRTGTLSVTQSQLSGNLSKSFESPGYPGIFYEAASAPDITGSVLAK